MSDEPTQEVKDFIQKKIDAVIIFPFYRIFPSVTPNARSDQKAEQEITKKIKPEGAVFPIEDTLLLKPELNYTRIATDHHSALERPMPSYDFGDVPAHLVFSVISSWNFLGIYRYLRF